MNEHNTVDTVTNGVVGVTGTAAGWIGYLHIADEFLKFASLLLGCAVAAVTLYRLIRPVRKD